jgi:hypothetical protein
VGTNVLNQSLTGFWLLKLPIHFRIFSGSKFRPSSMNTNSFLDSDIIIVWRLRLIVVVEILLVKDGVQF